MLAAVTHNSLAVTLTGSSAGLTQGQYLTFSSQPNTKYKIAAISGLSLTLDRPYSGSNASGLTITTYGFPWMPETGSSGQGPLLIRRQEEFGVHIVNVPNASSFTLYINDFLYGYTRFTDTGGFLVAGITITLPLIAGYGRVYYNATSQTLTFQGPSGGSVVCPPNSSVALVCDGTNWELA